MGEILCSQMELDWKKTDLTGKLKHYYCPPCCPSPWLLPVPCLVPPILYHYTGHKNYIATADRMVWGSNDTEETGECLK